MRNVTVRLLFLLVMVVALGSACSLSTGDRKGPESGGQPTAPPTITPPFTRTPIPTFTPFPTFTPGGGVFVQPTATRIVLAPTFTPFVPVFTWTPPVTALPYDVRISYPVDGSQVAGYITVVGSASHPRFLQYALEWGPDPNPGNLWYPLMSPRNQTVLNGGLGAWNTTAIPDGVYQLRLHVWLNDGTETFDIATGVRISNRAPTAVPSLTPTPRPNRAPVLDPIASQEVNAGASLDLTVRATDPDGDVVNLFVASSNPSVAGVQVISASQIRVTGVTAGTATISVTGNDNRGGLTTTAFIVTVRGLNRAPTLSPILEQRVEVGRTADVTISASDPDGDPLTVQAEADNTGVVLATVLGPTAVRLTGVAEGTANVTVTVNDGKGGVIRTTFMVRVGRPNLAPIVGTIPAQTLAVGDTVDVSYVASDPDGDPMTQTATSDTPGVVTATVSTPGTIRLTAVAAGSATVTLSLNDGRNPPTITTFPVTVVVGNVAPTINPIAPQTMSVGETRDVAFVAVDPEGDPLSQNVSSDNTGVVAASIAAPGTIRLNAVGAGTATVTLTVNDGHNPAVTAAFTVSVAAINLPPAVETIFPQTLGVGDTLDVPYTAVDPDGDALSVSVSVDNPAVVSASLGAANVITLTGLSAGSATVTLSVEDGTNPPVTMPFTVTVTANAPPSLLSIMGQTLNVGEVRDVPYTASDPEGDPLTATVTVDNMAVVTAAVNVPGTITLNAVGAGTATVTLSVSDGINAPVSAAFTVTVSAPNVSPVFAALTDQTLSVGESRAVPVSVSDPDGDPVSLSAASDNPGVVAAVATGPAEVTITGVAPGTATVLLDANDGRGGFASASFAVTVTGVNNAPIIQPIGDQSLSVGEQIAVAVSISDPDGDPLVVSAIAQNPGVVFVEVIGTTTINLQGQAAGVTTVEVYADDGQGGVSTASFAVTVSSVQPAFDLMAYPVVPQLSPSSAGMLSRLYSSAVLNFGTQGGVFAKVGDDPMDSPNFMAPFATGTYSLGNAYADLQGTIDFYAATPVRPALDPTINSFNVDSEAAGPDFGVDTLSEAAPAGGPCDAVGGGSRLACEYLLSRPSIALISFSAANVVYLPPEQFRSELQTLVFESMSNYGVIPVLATIPAGGGYTTEQLAEYNRAIVEVAVEAEVPLWNLWRAMQERGVSDPFSVAPDGPAVFSDAALSYGYNVRNLTALQTLKAVREAVGIN